eukprot:COSAG04_NODE_585_length_12348_cov_17.357907_9_plen_70_part_00
MNQMNQRRHKMRSGLRSSGSLAGNGCMGWRELAPAPVPEDASPQAGSELEPAPEMEPETDASLYRGFII